MVENNVKTDIAAKAKESFSWLSLLIRFLGLIEKLLPAFLIAYNNNLKQQNQTLKGQLELEVIKGKVNEKKQSLKVTNCRDADYLRAFLKRARDRGK